MPPTLTDLRLALLAGPLALAACAEAPAPASGAPSAAVPVVIEGTAPVPVPVVRIASAEARAGRPLDADAAAARAPSLARAAVPGAVGATPVSFARVTLDGHDLLVVRTTARSGVPAGAAAAAGARTGCLTTGRQWQVAEAVVLELSCPA